MKLFLALIALLVSTTSFAVPGPARAPMGTVRNVYSTTNVTTSAWVQLIASTTGPVSLMEVFDSSSQTLEIGVGASGSEVVQFIVVPGGNGDVLIGIPKGSRIAIKALSATASTGELDINLFN